MSVWIRNDPSPQSAAAIEVSTGKFLNWATGNLETPFVAANHLKPLQPIPTVPAPFTAAQDVDCSAIGNKNGIIVVAVAVDSTGAPLSVLDVAVPPGSHSATQGVFV